MNFIEFQNVTFGYSDDSEAQRIEENVIENMNLKIEKGDFVAVLGHNGCGKSTLAKLCNAILVPQSGKVLVDGIDTADEERLYDIRRKVG
ncbi:MAG: ATP-binding cassette domain-containing protein, partial [Clostridia bacterium]|nr:ATP-binding cassette domain-containing protein [Clostridia bacterium]